MPFLQTPPYMLIAAALIQSAMLVSHAQAHEMEGIDHVHLTDGIVHIVEPIPGVTSAPADRSAQTKTGVAPKATQLSGVVSLIVQAVLIGSVIVLLVVALRAGLIPRGRRREETPEETKHAPPQSTTPTPPA